MIAVVTGSLQKMHSLLFGPVVNHEDFVQMRAKELAEFLMSRVRQVLSPVGFAAKTHEKAVRKAISTVFHAHIGAPLEIIYGIDLARQRTEGVLYLSDLRRGRIIFELEQHNMSQDLGRLAIAYMPVFLDSHAAA